MRDEPSLTVKQKRRHYRERRIAGRDKQHDRARERARSMSLRTGEPENTRAPGEAVRDRGHARTRAREFERTRAHEGTRGWGRKGARS